MLFSVIIPVYNGEKFIDEAIRSVLEQTETDWELVVMNDGSADNTAAHLDAYRNDPRIRVLSQTNQGVSAARNNGIKAARGEYYAFLDADDIWFKNHLAAMRTLIEKYPEAGLYATFAKIELKNGKSVDSCTYFENKGADVFLDDFFEEYVRDKNVKMFALTTTCISRGAFQKAGGFPVGCAMGEDLELTLRAAAYYPVALSAACTAVYRAVNSTASKDRAFDPEWKFFDTVQALYDDEEIPAKKRENLKKLMAWFTMRRCRHYLVGGQRQKARRAFAETDKAAVSRRDLLVNRILLLLPSGLVARIFAIRWRGKA